MPFQENFDSFTNPDDFAGCAVYTWQSGQVKTIEGIFDHAYLDLDVGTAGMEGNQPMFLGKECDLIGARQGDTLTLSGKAYSVVGVQPDGTGMVLIKLEEK